ncbi:MAG: hypothetical protein HWE25_11890 [Alphaproteobacteria bacterium]|nr:hypothetical protein [Alphaproteobacteria bacterium]
MINRIMLFVASMWMFGLNATPALANEQTFTFEKGHTIDFLYITNRAKPTRTFQEYIDEVGPSARKLGFRSLGGIRIAGKPTQGNFFPDFIALGVWPGGLDARRKALEKLLEAAPNLHSLRMDIWSAFNMTNYAFEEEVQLEMSADNVYILTAYWMAQSTEMKSLEAALKETTSNLGGVVKLILKDGRSPFQYEHNPDLLVITEWENEAEAALYTEESKGLNALGVRHVNQFPIKLP